MAKSGFIMGRAAAIAAVLTGSVLVPAIDSGAAGPTTERVNTQPDGDQSNQPGGGLYPSVNANGNRVVFTSAATDMLKGDKDSGGTYQVYMRNRETDRNVLISVNNHGEPANGNSFFPLIAANGKAVVFMSEATNLVPNDDNGHQDVFLRDLVKDKTILVSDARGKTRHSANNNSYQPAGISNDGNFVVFISAATNLVTNVTDANGVEDVFYWFYYFDKDGDLHTGTQLVSHRAGDLRVTGNGVSGGLLGGGDRGGAALSGNGRCVAYGSRATNLTQEFTDANQAEVDTYMSCYTESGGSGFPDARRISTNTKGEQGNFASYTPALNYYGNVAAFYSTANNLADGDTNNGGDVIVAHLGSNLLPVSIGRANVKNNGSQDDKGAAILGSQALSNSGSKIALTTFGRLAGPTECVGEQVYLRDLSAKTTTLVSIMTNGKCGDAWSNYANISRNGSWVVWTGAANKLVPYDTNQNQDEFIRGPY